MSTVSGFSTYCSAAGVDSIQKYVSERPPSFSYGNVSYSDYEFKYKSDGWIIRKAIAIPCALEAGIIKVIYHFAKTIFLGIPKACFGDDRCIKAKTYCAVRDLEEAFGWIVTLFNDKRGTYLVQESLFQKECYNNFEKIKIENNNKLSDVSNFIGTAITTIVSRK